ncbi:MAG: aldo/keto reductase [Acidimicrobiia bacterium]|nr:aldo/keto reductase [Acidimicrobiia bacterium]MDH4365346.1 aldo/keto reductase [Acidimicrobiia bacterium]MDH5291410.1 aldo/keto reductase [Acidimicrobiia bacterium]
MIPVQAFGSTGHQSTRTIFGAAAFSRMSPERAATVLDLLAARGVNHIDTAASYGDSELRLAPWLATHRDEVFLATKTGDRTGSEARASLERSLERMGVHQVDLIQLHNLVEEDEWRTAFAPGGAVEALAAARDEGLCRFIGVTGHGTRIPRMHLRSLTEFPFNSVLFPYNHALLTLPAYRADAEELIAACTERGVAIQTIKAVARRRWAERGAPGQRSWYEPITDDGALARAVRFVLSRPGLFLNTTSDAQLLPAIFDAAAGPLDPPSEAELEADRLALGITPLFDGAELERI